MWRLIRGLNEWKTVAIFGGRVWKTRFPLWVRCECSMCLKLLWISFERERCAPFELRRNTMDGCDYTHAFSRNHEPLKTANGRKRNENEKQIGINWCKMKISAQHTQTLMHTKYGSCDFVCDFPFFLRGAKFTIIVDKWWCFVCHICPFICRVCSHCDGQHETSRHSRRPTAFVYVPLFICLDFHSVRPFDEWKFFATNMQIIRSSCHTSRRALWVTWLGISDERRWTKKNWKYYWQKGKTFRFFLLRICDWFEK